MTLLTATSIPLLLASALVWLSSISNLLALSAEVTEDFGEYANNQARERLVLAFVLIAFAFGVSDFRFSYHSAF